MSYATTDDLKARLQAFPGLLQDDTGAFDATLAQSHLDAASAEIDAYAGMRYETPVAAATAIPMLKNWELTLAEEMAYSANAFKGETPENVAVRVKAVREALGRLADGSIALNGATERDNSAGGAAIVETDSPVMTRERLGGY